MAVTLSSAVENDMLANGGQTILRRGECESVNDRQTALKLMVQIRNGPATVPEPDRLIRKKR